MHLHIFKYSRVSTLVFASALVGVSTASAQNYTFSASGSGITISNGWFTTASTSIAGTDLITSLGGTFSDSNVGISNVAITAEETTPFLGTPPYGPPSGPAIPFSSQGFSYDDLFYPAGNSPIVCTGYPVPGGQLDCFGVVFDLANGDSAELWSDGIESPGTPPVYNVAVAGPGGFLDYPNPVYGIGEVVNFNAVPEPSSFAFLGAGVLGLCAIRRRKRA